MVQHSLTKTILHQSCKDGFEGRRGHTVPRCTTIPLCSDQQIWAKRPFRSRQHSWETNDIRTPQYRCEQYTFHHVRSIKKATPFFPPLLQASVITVWRKKLWYWGTISSPYTTISSVFLVFVFIQTLSISGYNSFLASQPTTISAGAYIGDDDCTKGSTIRWFRRRERIMNFRFSYLICQLWCCR